MSPKLLTNTVFIILFTSSVYASDVKENSLIIPEKIDLGKVYDGERQEFSITIKNTSSKNVTVQRIFYTCQCFDRIDNTPFEIKSGDSKNFRIIFNSFKLKNHISKVIYVQNGDDIHKINIKGEVTVSEQPLLYFHHPEKIIVNRENILKNKNGYNLVSRITNTGKQPLKIEKIESPELIVVNLKKMKLLSGQGTNVKIHLNHDIAEGEYTVQLVNNSEKRTFPITLIVK